jgi:arabinose-5-phosphate isomerase
MTHNAAEILTIAQQVFRDEIAGLVQVEQHLDNSFVTAVELLLACRGKIIVSGMGKSGHIGNKIAATLASTGSAAFFMHPAEALHGDLGMLDSNDLLLAISYSGESDELSSIIPTVKHKQVKIISISGNPDSSLAKFSDCALMVRIDKEACPLNLAPTTSTTATLVLGDALAVALLSLRQFQPEDFALSHPGGSLGRKLLTKVSDIMHQDERLPMVSASALLKEVVFEISNKGLGLVAVVDEQQHMLGVITDGDLRRVLDGERDVRLLQAKDIMTANPKVIHVTNMAIDAVDIVNEYKIGGLLVVDDNNKVVGAFNVHDLFQAKLI